MSLVVLLFSTSAMARGLEDADTTGSVEWIAATSQTIVRATVLSVDPAAHRFTYHVDETMRGQADGDGVHQLAADETIPVFIQPGRPILLCISIHDRPGDYYYPPFNLSSTFNPPFWTNLGKPLTQPEDLLEYLRGAIATTPPGLVRSASLRPLNQEMRGVLVPRRASIFTVPVDARLQPLIEQMLKSDDEAMEWQGVYLLSQVPSPENLKRLKAYLSDPRLRIPPADPVSPWSQRSYYFRKWALDLLSFHEPPRSDVRLSEPGNIYHRAIWMPPAAIGLLIVLWLALGRVSLFRRRGRRLLGMTWAIVILLMIVWLRSNWVIDDFCYASGRRLYAFSVYQGSLRLEILHEFTERTPLSYRSFTPSPESGSPFPWHQFSEHPTVGPLMNVPRQTSPIPGDEKSYACFLILQPLWPLVLPLMVAGIVPVLVILRRRAVRIDRQRQGLCINCGYDLRSTPERCPECGMEVLATEGQEGMVEV